MLQEIAPRHEEEKSRIGEKYSTSDQNLREKRRYLSSITRMLYMENSSQLD